MARTPHNPYDADKPWLAVSRNDAAIAGLVFLDSLPEADPEVEGALWNDSGTPTVSEG